MTTAFNNNFAMEMFRFYSGLNDADKAAWNSLGDEERNLFFETATGIKRMPAVQAPIMAPIPSGESVLTPGTISDDLGAAGEPESVQVEEFNSIINPTQFTTQEENDMNTPIMTVENMDKAAVIARDLLKSYKQFARSADGGVIAWNMSGNAGGAGGSTIAYVSPFAMRELLNGEKLQKVEYSTNEGASAHYEVASARKVVIDAIIGTFRIFEPNLHVYNKVEGKYQERAGYVRVLRGELQNFSAEGIIIEKPQASQVEEQPGGTRLVVRKEYDWADKTGWVVLHGSRMDESRFTCGRLIEEKANVEAFYIVKNADGSPKTYTDRFGRERYETKKSGYGADLDAIRRHEIARMVAMGYIIVVTDWFNKTIKAGHVEEVGKGEQTVFLKKVTMDQTFLRIRKNETGKAWNEIKATANLLYGKSNAKVEVTMPDSVTNPETGEITPVYIKRVFNKNMQPINITRSEMIQAGSFTRLVNGRIGVGGIVVKATEETVDAAIRLVENYSNSSIKLLDM